MFWCVWQPGVELLEAAVGSVGESEHRRRVWSLVFVCTSLSVNRVNELEKRQSSFSESKEDRFPQGAVH